MKIDVNGPVNKALFKGAEVEARIDGRTLGALSTIEQQRYIDRFALGVAAYIEEMYKNGFEIVYYQSEDGEKIFAE